MTGWIALGVLIAISLLLWLRDARINRNRPRRSSSVNAFCS